MKTTIVWPHSPYKGLSYYTQQDVALFGGRSEDVRDCARILANDNTKVLLLHGVTGCGKSSFLRAGLIPFLESEIKRFQFIRRFDVENTKALFVRCTKQPILRLCEALYDWSEIPLKVEPPNSLCQHIDLTVIRGTDRDSSQFIQSKSRSVDSLIETLHCLSNVLPKTLVLVLDQAEEILTLGSNKEGEFDQKLFFDFIVKFSKACLDIKLIVTLRTEYFGYFFNELKDYWYDHDRFSSYLLKELSAAQLIEVIEKPISTSVPLKFLQGRCQPGEHYKFEFERGLTKQIVEDLKKYEAKGGIILPVLQIVCDRLFKQVSDDQVNKKVIVDKGLNKELSKVTFEDYRELDPFEEQMYSYVMSAILFKIENEVPGLNQVARNEEFELWMEFLCELVKAKPGNRASTDYKPSEALRASAENLNCKVKFEDMMNYLSNENRRILNQSVHLENSNSYPNSCYYSLGHDAIAVTLLKWIEARQLLLRPITQMDAFLSQLTSDIIDYTFNPHIEFTFCYPGLGIGSISVGGEVYNNYSAAIKNLIKNGHPKSTFILAECQELDSLYDAFLDEGDNNYVEMTPEKIRINFAKEESKVLQILVVDGSFGKNGMYNRDNAKGFDSSVHWWFVDTKFRFQAIILGDVVYIINTFGLPTNIGGQWRKPDSGNNHVEIVATRIKNHLLALQLHDQLVKEAAQYSKNLELAPQP